ncbi:MAG: protein adenylyltransferase SelO [Akkermansiaceae bacterium]
MSSPLFHNTYANLPQGFFEKVTPAGVPEAQLIKVNVGLAAELGIDAEWLQSEEGLAMLAGNDVVAGSEPLAQAYAGHQFGGFSPRLGDGRAILLGEVLDQQGLRRDIQLKGSGRTPFSRGGDGKSALGPVLREYIVSEAMTALGVPSTRALGAVSTGEVIVRHDGPQPGGVFTRVASSHIRVGTFQYFAAQRDMESVRVLADYAMARHFPQCLGTADDHAPYVEFFKAVIQAQADLIAHWMSLGFIHGVMNTDNTAVSGETIDYGPCAFMDDFHPQCVFSSIDVNARYAWGNQPNIGLWNLSRLAECIQPLFHDDEARAQVLAEEALNEFSGRFNDQYMIRFRAKFGISDAAPAEIIQDGLSMLANQQVDFTLFFRHLTSVAAGASDGILSAMFSDQIVFRAWLKMWRASLDESCFEKMKFANPVLIPRNHRIEEVIQAARKGDYAPFHRMNDALAAPFSEKEEYADLELAPEIHQRVKETFCGT